MPHNELNELRDRAHRFLLEADQPVETQQIARQLFGPQRHEMPEAQVVVRSLLETDPRFLRTHCRRWSARWAPHLQQDSSEAAGFLAKKRAETPLTIAVLAYITRILPYDTNLDRMEISKTSVKMQGKSQNAQQLIELVNESPLLEEASFRGSTRLDARSGLEIFEVNANVVKIGTD